MFERFLGSKIQILSSHELKEELDILRIAKYEAAGFVVDQVLRLPEPPTEVLTFNLGHIGRITGITYQELALPYENLEDAEMAYEAIELLLVLENIHGPDNVAIVSPPRSLALDHGLEFTAETVAYMVRHVD